MDTGEKLINISQLVDNYSQEHIAATLALHAFTGADCTSAFKGKVRPMKLLSQNSKFVHIFAAVGFTWTLNDDHIVNGTEDFTCRVNAIFGLVSPLISPHFRHADGFSPSTSRESISKSVSGAGLSIIFQIYRPLLTMVIMLQKREKWNHLGSRGTSFRWF